MPCTFAELMQPVTVVFFTLFRTDNPYSSISLSMAKALGSEHPVIYINHPYSLKDVFKGLVSGDKALKGRLWPMLLGRNCYETLPGFPDNFIAVQPPVTLPINWLPAGAVYEFLQKINNAIVLKSIRRALKKQQVGEWIYFNCYDPFFAGTIPADMGAMCRIYQCIDDISQDPYTARHGERLENEAVAAADLTLVTSTNLYRLKQPFARRIEHFFNAADVDHFGRVRTETFDRPAELNGRPGKVIGFIGNLDALRIDYPLLLQIATRYPDHTLLLVGPVNSPELSALGLDQLPNVVLAGSRNLADLPPLLQHFDVAIIPFLKNTLTKSIYPLKINEYLAAGKPVVATAFSDDIRGFGHCAYIAEDDAAFLQYIAQAIADDSPEKIKARTDTAAGNTWAARIGELWGLVG